MQARCQEIKDELRCFPLQSCLYGGSVRAMDVREMARLGGLARAKAMTAKERRESALKASKAAAVARTKKAKARKKNASP